MDTLGIVLKKLRESKNLTISELAAKAGLGRGTIGDIETGKNKSTISTVDKLSKSLGLNKFERERLFASMLPKDIGNKILTENNSDKFLENIFEILKLLEKDEQKTILNNIVDKVELKSYQNGTLDSVKELLNDVKMKIEEL